MAVGRAVSQRDHEGFRAPFGPHPSDVQAVGYLEVAREGVHVWIAAGVRDRVGGKAGLGKQRFRQEPTGGLLVLPGRGAVRQREEGTHVDAGRRIQAERGAGAFEAIGRDERRGETFVTRKISLAAARIAQGEQDKLYLGNLDARRDWGYAKDYVECMWLILQHDVPEDFVIATGEMHTVREFATLAFKEAGIELRREGEGINEKGIDVDTGKPLVEVDPKYFRPSEVEQLLGDPTKARTLLGWNPCKTSFEELVRIMVRHDMEKVKRMIANKH